MDGFVLIVVSTYAFQVCMSLFYVAWNEMHEPGWTVSYARLIRDAFMF